MASAAAMSIPAISAEEMAAFNRFCECAEDFDSGGYDVSKDMMKRLACIGLVRSLGFGRYETTGFGMAVRSEQQGEAATLESLIEQHRVAITPEYEGGFTAELYGEQEVPHSKGYGKTPREAMTAALATEGGERVGG